MFCHFANTFKKSSNNCVQFWKFFTDEVAKNSFTFSPDLEDPMSSWKLLADLLTTAWLKIILL
jgi:hypothetical protein